MTSTLPKYASFLSFKTVGEPATTASVNCPVNVAGTPENCIEELQACEMDEGCKAIRMCAQETGCTGFDKVTSGR